MFWIYDQRSVENTPMFYLRAGWGCTAGTADPNWPYDTKKSWVGVGVEFARAVIAWGLAGHQSARCEQLWDFLVVVWGLKKFFFIFTWFSWFGVFFVCLFPFLPTKLSLFSTHVFFHSSLLILSLNPPGGAGNEQEAVWCLGAYWG